MPKPRNPGPRHSALCWLRVWEKNPRAIALYERYGFEITGSEPYHVGTMSETVLIMTKTEGKNVSR
jgi:ribosomal protein S18 acetylase RimI-like enzyme